MMNDLISIIIPVYNTEEYLSQCLETVVNQTYSNLQIILVNDGSTDSSLEICYQFQMKDSRIEILNKTRAGLSAARNDGMNAAKGEYICFIDSDDYVKDDYIEVLYGLVTEFNCDISICGYYKTYENGDQVEFQFTNEGYIDKHDLYNSLLHNDNIGNYACNKMYRRTLFQGISYPVGKAFEDIYTTYLLIEASDSIAISQEKVYFYRQRSGSLSNCINLKNLSDQEAGIAIRNEYIQSHYPDLSRACDKDHLKFLIVIYNQISKGFAYSKELETYRNKICLYWKKTKCDQVKYNIMCLCIVLFPSIYSRALYHLHHNRRK